MLKHKAGDDVPSEVDISREDFMKYRDGWKLWRAVGRYDGNGSWIPQISFKEAAELPKAMLDVFQELDFFLAQMQKYMAKQQGKPTGVK
jgi:hypothetical protein